MATRRVPLLLFLALSLSALGSQLLVLRARGRHRPVIDDECDVEEYEVRGCVDDDHHGRQVRVARMNRKRSHQNVDQRHAEQRGLDG